MIEYKFEEDKNIAELMEYVNATYSQHYAGKYQATDMIIDAGHGTGFNIGNVMKYAKRYGKKGGYNRADLMKILHYTLIQLHVHDLEHAVVKNANSAIKTPSEYYTSTAMLSKVLLKE